MWISDHFQPWRHTGGRAPFSLAWLAAVGERTQRVLLGTSVLTPTFRYHPSVIAHAFATLACLYPGRAAALGIGSGEAMNEVAPTGMAWPEFKERYARLRESVSLMRQLWSSDFVTFAGTYYKTSTATLYDRPAEGVPVYIAAGGPQVAKYVGRVANGFICTSGSGAELYRDLLLPALAEGAKESGRDPNSLDRLIEIKVSFDSDRDRALNDTRYWARWRCRVTKRLVWKTRARWSACRCCDGSSRPASRRNSRRAAQHEPCRLRRRDRPGRSEDPDPYGRRPRRRGGVQSMGSGVQSRPVRRIHAAQAV